MYLHPKITSYTIVYCFLLIAKIASVVYGGEIAIVSSNVFSRGVNIFYILGQDIVIGALFALLLYRAKGRKNTIILSAMIVYMILYTIDIWLYTIFLSRLAPSQYALFVTKDTILQFVSYAGILFAILMTTIVGVGCLYKVLQQYNKTYTVPFSIRTILLIVLFVGMFSGSQQELSPYRTNVILLQLQRRGLANKIYTHTHYSDYMTIQQSQSKSPNIIVLFAESWSAIDSIRAGGLYDNLPKFDAIQAHGVTLTNFFAHGCTSDAAHIAFLQGTEPLMSTVPGNVYQKYKNYRGYLPAYFQQYGYNTQFFSTVSLNFLDQRSYIEQLGFDQIWGEEQFVTAPKYVFDAAPDVYLYDTILTQLQNATGNSFFVAQTVSSHHPYNTPYGKTFSAAIRYSDDTFADFYAKLRDMHYFDDGYLIVFADHRKIAPLTKEEFQHFGRSAYNRGVATIIGPDIQANSFDDTPYQHADFYHGLKLLIGHGPVTISSMINDPFGIYAGRDRSIRYCQYADPRYYITEKNGQTDVFDKSTNQQAKSYILGYENRHNNKQKPQITKKTDTHGITLIAHQGSPAQQYPANSIAAMRQAAKDGAKGVEFDVSWTTDGYHVVVHGPDMGSIQCTGTKKDFIYQYAFAELREYCTLKDGTALLTLTEMLEKLDGLFDQVYIDIKVYNNQDAHKQGEDIINIVSQFDRHQKIIPVSYDPILANYLLEQSEKTTIGRDSYDFDLPKLSQSPIAAYLIGLNLLTPKNIVLIQKSKIPVVAYTVRSYDEMEKVLDAGITNILVSNIAESIQHIEQYRTKKQQ